MHAFGLIAAPRQGLIQSAFLWGYTATQLLGGALADRHGGRAVIAAGVAWFSVASLLLPAVLSGPVAAAGLTLPAVLLARTCVVRWALLQGARIAGSEPQRCWQ